MKKILFFISFIVLLDGSAQALRVVNNYKGDVTFQLFNVDYQRPYNIFLKSGTWDMVGYQINGPKQYFEGLIKQMQDTKRDTTKIIAQFREKGTTIFCSGEIKIGKDSIIGDLLNQMTIKIDVDSKIGLPTSCHIENRP